MTTPRVLAVVALLLISTTSRAQPGHARAAVALPVPAATLAAAVNSQNSERSLVLLDIVRIVFDAPDSHETANGKLRSRVLEVLRTPSAQGDTVPLPLSPQVWRDVILEAQVPDAELIAAIFSSRTAALLYYGLSSLDDGTLEWLAGEREILQRIRKHPGTFAICGRSLRVRNGRLLIPGGAAAAELWRQVIGADPADAASFVRALFTLDKGRTAFLYDTIAQLDAERQAFALNRSLEPLSAVFRDFARDWDIEMRPFARPQLDPTLLLAAIRVDAAGHPLGPMRRSLWERVFRDDMNSDVPFREVPSWTPGAADEPLDAAWLAKRIHLVTYSLGRRRLDTLLFAQRLFDDSSAAPHVIASVLRAFASMPALMLALERAGVRDPSTLLAAARHAHAVNKIGGADARETAIAIFQSAAAFVGRGAWSRSLSPAEARNLIESLAAIPVDLPDGGRAYSERVATWLRTDLFNAAPLPPVESSDPVEEAVLSLLAGLTKRRSTPIVEWEGAKYLVDPGMAEMARLRRVRERQGTLSLDQAITQLFDRERLKTKGREQAQRDFRNTVVSVLYAAHLGDPEGPALAEGNVALRHDLGMTTARPGAESMTPWHFGAEVFGGPGWRVRGSLLGLDAALRRLALRRLDSGRLPSGPKLSILERQTAVLTAALMNPHVLTDDERDRVAAAVERGRRHVDRLRKNPDLASDVAEKAGLSAWRREALRWSLLQGDTSASHAFTLAELFWLGAERANLDGWGAASMPMTGCLCLALPRPLAWENLTGRPSTGLLATLGIDVNLLIATALAERKLPAALLPAVLAFAMQDVIDDTTPAYFDDWPAFGRAARAITPDRIDDYIAALTAAGPLVPAARGTSQAVFFQRPAL